MDMLNGYGDFENQIIVRSVDLPHSAREKRQARWLRAEGFGTCLDRLNRDVH